MRHHPLGVQLHQSQQPFWAVLEVDCESPLPDQVLVDLCIQLRVELLAVGNAGIGNQVRVVVALHSRI